MGINERKKMFILVVLGVIYSHFNVSEKDCVVCEFPNFFFRFFFCKVGCVFQCPKERAVKNLVVENGVGNKHYSMKITKFDFYLGTYSPSDTYSSSSTSSSSSGSTSRVSSSSGSSGMGGLSSSSTSTSSISSSFFFFFTFLTGSLSNIFAKTFSILRANAFLFSLFLVILSRYSLLNP